MKLAKLTSQNIKIPSILPMLLLLHARLIWPLARPASRLILEKTSAEISVSLSTTTLLSRVADQDQVETEKAVMEEQQLLS